MIERFFNSISFVDENNEFQNATINKVLLNKSKDSCEVFIENEKPINPVTTLALVKKAKGGINGKTKCHINFIYDEISDEDVIDAFKVILGEIIIKRPSLVSLENKNIKIVDEIIVLELDTQSEEYEILRAEIKTMKLCLEKLGFYDFDITTAINVENETNIRKMIEDKKNDISDVFVPKDEPVSNNNGFYGHKVDYKRKGVVTISSILQEENAVHLEAQVFGAEYKVLKNRETGKESFLAELKITDNTDSMMAKMFCKDEEDMNTKAKELTIGTWFEMNGQVRIDNFSGGDLVFNLRNYKKMEVQPSYKRIDDAPEKRVELHAHTKMSLMDGVIDENDLVKQAMSFGHRGIAITDHDCVQAFPNVFNTVTKYNKDLKKNAKAKVEELEASLEEAKQKENNEEEINNLTELISEAKENLNHLPFFKAGYGAELEVCESTLNVCFNPRDEKIEGNTFVVFDTETTGFNPGLDDQMIEIGGVKIKDGEVIDRFDELINPLRHIDEQITSVTDISDDDVKDADIEENVTKRFKEWIGDLPLVAHNAKFDKNMLDMAYYKYSLGELKNPIIDTLMLSRIINRDLKKHSLKALGKYYDIDTGEADEDEDEVSDVKSGMTLLQPEIAENILSIKVDGEEIIIKKQEEVQDMDYATNQVVTKYANKYYLNTIHKASKTDEVNIEIQTNEGIELIDFNNKQKLHPAENDISVRFSTEIEEVEFIIKIYVGQHHGADVDSENTGYIFNKMLNQIKGIENINELNDLAKLEDIAFRNNQKLMDHIGELCSYKNYVMVPDEDSEDEIDPKCGYPFEKYGDTTYRWKYPWCNDNNLQMYENIPGKTFSEHLANVYDSVKHITFIAKNKTGLKNLFKLVSYGNTNFLMKNARVPRKIIEDNREGLMIGSSCLNGEIFNIALTRTDEDLIKAMSFYDYIEVQPPSNYMHLLRGHDLNSIDQLHMVIEKIIRCAKKAQKIVVATGDVHNLTKDDLIYREIIVNQNVPGKGRHPLAKYLNGLSKNNTNEDNINKIISESKMKGSPLSKIDIKVLKYIYILTKVSKIPITTNNISEIYVENKKDLDDIQNSSEKLNIISKSIHKLKDLGIIAEANGIYVLVENYEESDKVIEGHIPNQYFLNTREMKKEFEFLNDKDLIDEIVVKNPNLIIDSVEEIEVIDEPLKPYSPIIEHSQETCRDLVFDKAHSMYGDPLPRNIEERIGEEFYGGKIYMLVDDYINEKHPGISDEEKDKVYLEEFHNLIMEGYDKVVDTFKCHILNDEETKDLSEKDALQKAKDELSGIIGGGFDVIYLIAQKLVKHSNDRGYLVGSRGSVGSSFVAAMMGITECNSLPPHYYCPECHYSMFHEEDGSDFSYVDKKTKETEKYLSGFDLPERECPKCGTKMIHQGNDMPFATFLGFQGEKVPDIDLNFSGDDQPYAHAYTKVLFGTDNVYRAGTISTVADKTAFGYVQGFFEERLFNELKIEAESYGLKVTNKDDLKKKGIIKSFKRIPEVERLAVGCTDVKRTTGQHPGGIVVVPDYKDIWDFTPFQYPADDPTSAWRTTHFDYHKIEADLLKLDILGHDDPTVLRMLQDLSGIDVTQIDLGDKDTMKIFKGPEVLGVDRYDLRGLKDKNGVKYCPTGTLGVPEFGTSFLLGMLEETKPETFAELIKISGLSHGTDVWLGNARDLCTPDASGNIRVPFKNVIGCRDDIMVNLIAWGMKPNKAFKIMEFVRKGRAAKAKKPDDPQTWLGYKKEMTEAGIPDWYQESCEKIKYMFPKAHATAYVTSAFRIAWFKVHHPIWYYCAYLSIRRDQFDIPSMVQGADAIRAKIDELDEIPNISNKDDATRETLYLCLEMCLRGFYFKNVDVEKSDGKNFVITEDGKGLIIPFRALDGLGDNVAKQIVKARKDGEFISIEDLEKRGKVNKSAIQKLKDLGCLDSLPESNQLSLF